MVRRDFTINALAASLMPSEFGRLLDDFGGLRDLRERHIRALHERSFIDDPTRIFRAVRFEKRLDFRIVRSTEQWIVKALSRSFLEELEDYRIATELRLILEEAARNHRSADEEAGSRENSGEANEKGGADSPTRRAMRKIAVFYL
jgi:tRNA nucleotidyltransferase (CCA-adding enzyme)